MKRKRAFTLIELLVVVAIIAILAALLAPNFFHSANSARAAHCANQLRSLGQGIVQYLSDSRGTMFALNADEPWPQLLHRNYVKDWRVFRSPFDKPTQARPKREEDPVPISYGLNQKMFDTFEGRWTAPKSSLIMLAPAVDVNIPGKEVAFLSSAVSTSNLAISPAGSSAGFGTHGNREIINVLFADSHVDAMEWKKFSENSSESGKRQWDPMYP